MAHGPWQDMLLLGRAMEEKAFLALGMRVTSEDVPLEVLERLLEEEAMLLLHLPERLSRRPRALGSMKIKENQGNVMRFY